ncbi:MAG TPA: DinB family protein [Chitinophagaceae bacterium]|nr:DinB family protein [Chitinophagaceae bacterium]
MHLELFDKYNLEQLNIVPDKFNNNLVWNIGHIIAAQQSLVYKTSNLPMHITDEYFDKY